MSKRVYISGPMTGIEDYNRPAFNAAAENLRAQGYLVENPASVQIEDGTWSQYMRIDIGMLLRCDTMVMLPGWMNSPGARAELFIARTIGIPVLDYPKMVPIMYGIETSITSPQVAAARVH